MNNSAIPVLYYHSVANHKQSRSWSFLSCDIKTFTLQMQYLKTRGYHTCNWDELYEHLQGERPLRKNTVMIQFDDGFLDNWTVVYPLMKRLGFKFSIVVTPEFITKHPVRDFSNITDESHLNQWWGYLSEEELIAMHHSGLVDIQAHGFTHTWLPSNSTVIDIYDGTQLEPWILWNQNLHVKPTWLTDPHQIPHGYPIFEHDKSLSNLHAFVPDDNFIHEAIALYDASKTKKENLSALNTCIKKSHNAGRYETPNETEHRLKKELLGTREYLEKLLEKKVEYLVWPGGGNSDYVQQLAFEYGYKLITKGTQFNRFNSKNSAISRVAGFHQFFPRPLSPYLNIALIQLQIWRAQGNGFLNLLFDCIKKLRALLG